MIKTTVKRKTNKISKKINDKTEDLRSLRRDVVRRLVRETEKEYNLTSGILNAPNNKISTGHLMLDTVMGGGIGSYMTVLAGLEGSFKCVRGDTLVNTNEGFLEFKEFVNIKGLNKVSNLNTLSIDGPRKVSHTYKGCAKTIHIKTRHGYEIEGTYEHPMLVLNENLDYIWKRLDELTTEDWIVVKSNKYNCQFGTDNTINLNMATIMGYLLANGYYQTLSSGDINVINRFNKAVKAETGLLPNIIKTEGKTAHNLVIRTQNNKGFFKNRLVPLGYTAKKSKEKIIPLLIRKSPQNIIHEFLESYFECDSGSDKKGVINLVTASKKLSKQLHVLLLTIYNIRGSIRNQLNKACNSKKPKLRRYYIIEISGYDARLFLHNFKRAKCHWNAEEINRERTGGGYLKVVPHVRKITKETYDNVKISANPGNSTVKSLTGKLIKNFRRPDYIRTSTSGSSDNPHATEFLFYRENWDKFLNKLSNIDIDLPKKLKVIKNSGYRYEQVISITKGRKKHNVYDLTVPKTHAFIANGLVSHNSSTCLTVIGNAIRSQLPFVYLADSENAINDLSYASVLMKCDAYDAFLGEKSSCFYYTESNMEIVFNSVRKNIRNLPDKIWRNDRNQWYYVFNTTKSDRALKEAYGYTEKSHDSELYKITGRYWCPCGENEGGLQGLISIDSISNLIPTNLDEKDTGAGRAAQARGFSENFPKVMGLLKEKNIGILSTAQLKTKPEASYSGQPIYYISGGNALAYNTSLRALFMPRQVPSKDSMWVKGIAENGYPTGDFGAEKSIYGGEDHYKYVYAKVNKNKLGLPNMETYVRLCYRQGNAKPLGLDPVHDLVLYCQKTDRFEPVREKGKKQAFKLHLEETKGQVFDLFDLKCWVMSYVDKNMTKKIEKQFGGNKIPDLRKSLFREIKKGKTYSLIKKKGTNSLETEDIDLEE